jgi:hypothetical protein
MADAFARYESLKKANPGEDNVVLAQLASADAIVSAVDELRKQVVTASEELVEVVYDMIHADDFDDEDDFEEEFDN